jgi:hypothetical protein
MAKSESGSNSDYTGTKVNPSSLALYEFASELTIEAKERQEILRRLKQPDDIALLDDLGYATFNPHVRSFDAAWDGLKRKEPSIPGLDLNVKPRQMGLSIPVRSIDGGATAIVVRDKEGVYRFMKSDSDSKVVPLTHVSQASKRNKQAATPKVRITEGILKADLADLYAEDMPCIGIHGVGYIPRDLVQVLRTLGVGRLHIAMDVEENVATDRMKMELYQLAKSQGIVPIIETWSPRYKGVDDALVAGVEIEQVDEEVIDALSREAGIDLVYIKQLGAFANVTDLDNKFFKKEVVSTYYAMSGKEMTDKIRSGFIRRVEKADVLPGDPRRIAENTLNLWSPPREYPLDDKATVRRLQRVLIRHLLFLIPDRTERRLFMQWAAHIIQHPAHRVRWAVILFSEAQQTGKTSTVMAIAKAVGERNFNTVSNDTLKSRFNAPLSGKQLILINEVDQKERYEVVGRLKEMITDKVIQIEQKYMPAVMVKNIASFIMTTNHDNALKIGSSDRRFMAIQCAEEQASKEHYKELAWAIEHKLCGTVIRQMASKMNMEGFSADQSPKRTATTEKFIEASRSVGEEWAAAVVAGEQWPGCSTDFISINQLRQASMLREVAPYLPKDFLKFNPNTVGAWLREAGAKSRQVRNPKDPNRKAKRFWVLRNYEEKWKDAPGESFFPTTLTVVGEENDSPKHEEQSWGEFKAIPLPTDTVF